MPEVKWIKITTDMFDDEKIRLLEAMPDADTLLVIWVKLICQAGKVNADGYIFLAREIPYTEEQLATILNRPVNTVKLALRAFVTLQMIEYDENGTLFLPNFEKHQNISGMERIREKTRLRVQKHRQIKAGHDGNGTVTLPSVTVTQQKENKKENKKENNIYALFCSFWLAYPKKVSKPQAEKAYNKIKPDETLAAEILAGLERWKQSPQWLKDNGQFIPYPATWLNNRRWEDEVENGANKRVPGRESYVDHTSPDL